MKYGANIGRLVYIPSMFIENYNKIKCLLVCVGVYRHFVIIVAEVL